MTEQPLHVTTANAFRAMGREIKKGFEEIKQQHQQQQQQQQQQQLQQQLQGQGQGQGQGQRLVQGQGQGSGLKQASGLGGSGAQQQQQTVMTTSQGGVGGRVSAQGQGLTGINNGTSSSNNGTGMSGGNSTGVSASGTSGSTIAPSSTTTDGGPILISLICQSRPLAVRLYKCLALCASHMGNPSSVLAPDVATKGTGLASSGGSSSTVTPLREPANIYPGDHELALVTPAMTGLSPPITGTSSSGSTSISSGNGSGSGIGSSSSSSSSSSMLQDQDHQLFQGYRFGSANIRPPIVVSLHAGMMGGGMGGGIGGVGGTEHNINNKGGLATMVSSGGSTGGGGGGLTVSICKEKEFFSRAMRRLSEPLSVDHQPSGNITEEIYLNLLQVGLLTY